MNLNTTDFEHDALDGDGLQRGRLSACVRDFAIGVAGVQPGVLAADISTGRGFMAENLVKVGARVIVVDSSGKMQTASQHQFGPKATVMSCCLDDDGLPIASRSVERVFANMVLHHTETPFMAISEMKRILRPGGRLVMTDLDKHDVELLRDGNGDRVMGFYQTDIRFWLTEVGFSNIIVNTIPGMPCAKESTRGADRAAVGLFMATGTA